MLDNFLVGIGTFIISAISKQQLLLYLTFSVQTSVNITLGSSIELTNNTNEKSH